MVTLEDVRSRIQAHECRDFESLVYACRKSEERGICTMELLGVPKDWGMCVNNKQCDCVTDYDWYRFLYQTIPSPKYRKYSSIKRNNYY